MNDPHHPIDLNFSGSDAITETVQPYTGRRPRLHFHLRRRQLTSAPHAVH